MSDDAQRLATRNLLADLETRQDELLRQLSELEERTRRALDELTAAAQPKTAEPQPAPAIRRAA